MAEEVAGQPWYEGGSPAADAVSPELIGHIEALTAERDALAAQVAALRDAIEACPGWNDGVQTLKADWWLAERMKKDPTDER